VVSGTQKAQPARRDAVTAEMGARPMRRKDKRKQETYRPGQQNQQLNNQVNEGANDSVWKVKCLEEIGEERLSAQRRVGRQCESHSSQ
jgi:hypothetical protein